MLAVFCGPGEIIGYCKEGEESGTIDIIRWRVLIDRRVIRVSVASFFHSLFSISHFSHGTHMNIMNFILFV